MIAACYHDKFINGTCPYARNNGQRTNFFFFAFVLLSVWILINFSGRIVMEELLYRLCYIYRNLLQKFSIEELSVDIYWKKIATVARQLCWFP